ncbi:MAG TPA: SpoIIE family protein phosphatase [Actinomycetota bacterium]|nr:SpoIIE family protein phosphatase [Actinomycetota bacterium]
MRAPGSVERFGSDALAETVAGDRGLDAMLDGLLAAVREANGGELSDDVAILCVARSS